MKNTEHVLQKRWLSPTELENEFGFSRSTQAKYRMDRKIPFNKLGKYIRYDRYEIDAWLEDAKVV